MLNGFRQQQFYRGALLMGLLLSFVRVVYGQAGGAAALPPGDGKDLLAVACTQCHNLQNFLIRKDGLEGWKYTVENMVLRGAQLSPEESATVVQYLFANFGPGRNPMQTGALPPDPAISRGGEQAKTISLPEGMGKELVETRCSICHDLGRVVATRRKQAEWERITKNMMERGPQVTPEQTATIITYLSAQFGTKE